MAIYVDLDKIIDVLEEEYDYEKVRDLYEELSTLEEEVFERPKWISVDDALPTVYDEETWVMLDNGHIDTDSWEGDRGEPGVWANAPEEDRNFTKSGWYSWTAAKVIKWAPLVMPEPEEDS